MRFDFKYGDYESIAKMIGDKIKEEVSFADFWVVNDGSKHIGRFVFDFPLDTSSEQKMWDSIGEKWREIRNHIELEIER